MGEVIGLLTRVEIENFKSIYKASVPLSPFTLLVGANGTGKSNFLGLLRLITKALDNPEYDPEYGEEIVRFYELLSNKHYNYREEEQKITIYNSSQKIYKIQEGDVVGKIPSELYEVRLFSLDPKVTGQAESLGEILAISENGKGIVSVLDALKTGDREDLFDKIESTLSTYIPEIEKLSFVTNLSTRTLQVREKHIPKPILVRDLSEGTQLVLLIITLLYQENRPSLICIEDIDRGLHPRLFQKIIELCFDLTSRDDGVQIIATTHNPYLVDEFKGYESAVIIVEKTNGETTFTPLSERLENLEPGEEPLGSLWYSGFVGGVPQGV